MLPKNGHHDSEVCDLTCILVRSHRDFLITSYYVYNAVYPAVNETDYSKSVMTFDLAIQPEATTLARAGVV